MLPEIKAKWNTELDEPLEAMREHQAIIRADGESARADQMSRWLTLTLCALGVSAWLHYWQASSLREASQTILALQGEVFALQSQVSPAVRDFRKPFEKGAQP